MAQLHDKISGCFRNERNVEAFLAVRIYLQTGRKHNRYPLELLHDCGQALPWLPTVAVPGTG